MPFPGKLHYEGLEASAKILFKTFLTLATVLGYQLIVVNFQAWLEPLIIILCQRARHRSGKALPCAR